jgi:hypothetical protein
MHLWDRLMDQATHTLNMLQPSRKNPQVLAYTQLEGTFDFNKTPLAPPGTKVIIHEQTNHQQTWDPHGTNGWYLHLAIDHYQCYRVYTCTTMLLLGLRRLK